MTHCQFGHRCSAVINDGNQADGGEAAGSSGGTPRRNSFASGAGTCLKRLTKKKAKDPKKVAAERAGATAHRNRLLDELQAAKELLRPPVSAADNDGTSASPKDAKRTDERPEPYWIPWIIGACLAGGSLAYVFACLRENDVIPSGEQWVGAAAACRDEAC